MGNFLMIAIPLCLITGLGWFLLTGMQFLDSGQKSSALSLLWPDKVPSLSVQYAANSLLQKMERKEHLKEKEVATGCRILEAQGIQVAVKEKGAILYLSSGAEEAFLDRETASRCQGISPALLWDERGFALRYISATRDRSIFAIGTTPLSVPDKKEGKKMRQLAKILFFVLVGGAVLLLLWIGRQVSQALSKQILEPLLDLKEAARKIQAGQLDAPLTVRAGDELGETCREFDRMRRELLSAREMRERYENNRRALLAGISHDLSTPLTSLRGHVSGILDGIAKTKEKQRQYLEHILHTINYMEKLVDSLFLFSKFELGKIDFQLSPVCLQAYLADWITETAATVKKRGLSLSLESDIGSAVVLLDRTQFPRVLDNLVENSIKYKKEEPCHLRVTLTENEADICLRFADDGMGVATEDLPQLFDSFYRTDPARSHVSKGSGLGLAIAKQILLGMQGTIWAEETPGGGLTIAMKLPKWQEKETAT